MSFLIKIRDLSKKILALALFFPYGRVFKNSTVVLIVILILHEKKLLSAFISYDICVFMWYR